jgi:hypothetical protein
MMEKFDAEAAGHLKALGFKTEGDMALLRGDMIVTAVPLFARSSAAIPARRVFFIAVFASVRGVRCNAIWEMRTGQARDIFWHKSEMPCLLSQALLAPVGCSDQRALLPLLGTAQRYRLGGA